MKVLLTANYKNGMFSNGLQQNVITLSKLLRNLGLEVIIAINHPVDECIDPPTNILIIEDKEAVLDRSVSILSDNLVNEILYILKFCNLSNDSENAYIYIIMYETLWFGFKMLKSSKNNVLEENEILLSEKDTIKLVKDLIFNIILYLTIKNLLIANFLVLVNH